MDNEGTTLAYALVHDDEPRIPDFIRDTWSQPDLYDDGSSKLVSIVKVARYTVIL